MKKFLVTAFLVWSFFLLQTAVCPWFAFGGIKPNLLILLTASIGLMEGEKPGMWTGFSCGLLADLFAANGMSLTAVGYLCGKANRLFFPEDILLPLGVIAAADTCVSLVCYIVMFFMRARLDIGYYILHVILPETVYTIVVAFIFYPLLLFLHKRMSLADRGSTE